MNPPPDSAVPQYAILIRKIMNYLLRLLILFGLVAHALALDMETIVPENPAGVGGTQKAWTYRETHTDRLLISAAWSGSEFVAVGKMGSIFLSDDGIQWDSISPPMSFDLFDITWAGSEFIAVGRDAIFPRRSILYSSDGYTWRHADGIEASTDGFFGVACSPEACVAVGAGGQIATSIHGDNWSNVVFPDSTSARMLYGVTWSGKEFVAVGESWDASRFRWSSLIARSKDGIHWSFSSLKSNGLLFDVTWTGSQFVAVGYLGEWGNSSAMAATSANGTDWIEQPTGIANYLRAVESAGSELIAVGNDGIILTSADGTDWTGQTQSVTQPLYGITFSHDRVVVVGTAGTILTSPLSK